MGSRDILLPVLISSFDSAHSREDRRWIYALAEHLQSLADRRYRHVKDWIDDNVARFPSEHADIQNLRRRLNELSRDIRLAVELCALECANCRLFCVKGKRHEGDHDCDTNHYCPYECGLDDNKSCGFRYASPNFIMLRVLHYLLHPRAGHDGAHMYESKLGSAHRELASQLNEHGFYIDATSTSTYVGNLVTFRISAAVSSPA